MAIAWAGQSAGALAQAYQSGSVSELAILFPPQDMALGAGELVWAKDVRAPAGVHDGVPSELRLRFSDISLMGNLPFRIEIADATGKVHDVLGRERLSKSEAVWTKLVPGDFASVRVRGAGASSALRFTIDKMAFTVESVALESIFGQNELEDIATYNGPLKSVVDNVEGGVARLSFIRNAAMDKCSAFRVATDLILTNSHCIADETACASAVAQFGYRKTPSGAIEFGEQVRCTDVVAVDPGELDVALLRVSPAPGDKWAITQLLGDEPAENVALFVIQHPGGEPKKISAVECHLQATAATSDSSPSFAHTCDTKRGSSGSPVFDTTGTVVGQHRAGHSIDGLVTRPSIGTKGKALFNWLQVQMAMEASDPLSRENTEPQPSEDPDANNNTLLDEMRKSAVPLPLPTVSGEPPKANDDTSDVETPSVEEPGSAGEPPATAE
jgi:hypothetical protein